MIWAERSRMLPFPKETPQAVVEHLARRTLEVLTFVHADQHDEREHLRMELSPQAQWRYAQLYRGELHDGIDDGAIGSLLERRAPMLLRLRDAAGSMSMNTPPAAKAHWPILCEANQRMERLKSKVSNLEGQMRPLQQALATPERFALARKQLDDLMAQRKALSAEAQTVDGQLTKIAKRLTDLESRIATETKSASRALLNTEAEFVVPENLTKLEVEQRITRASQAELERQRDAIQGQLAGLPDAVRKARDHFIHCRAAMAEIELHEQLMPVMNALARASAARRQINYHHDESRFPVEIPRDLIEAASDALAAEMPAA